MPQQSMTAAATDDRSPLLPVGRAMKVTLATLLVVAILVATAEAVSAVGSDPDRPEIVDFHPFYLAGRMVWQGHFAEAYQVAPMRALQRAFGGGRDVFMPFVYPPSFGLVMAPFARLPIGPAFLLFVASTLAFYAAVLRRLAGAWFWPALLAISPILFLDIRSGQNGMLTGGLAGLSAALVLERRGGLAGLAAGALAFKPQMATMLPVLFALRRDGRALVASGVAALALSGLAVAMLGRDTVAGFLGSTAVVADFMAAGSFPLHRMTSIYAFALSFGAPARLALILHGVVAAMVLAGAAATAWRIARDDDAEAAKAAAGVTLMATAFASPYFFDYDLTIFGAALALMLPALARAMPRRRLVLLLLGVGLVEAQGLLATVIGNTMPRTLPSFGGPALLVCYVVMLVTLRRRPIARPAQDPIPAA